MRIDVETLIQILFFVLIFGVAFIRFLYRSFVKPLVDAEAARRKLAERGGAEEPEDALRRLLQELRGKAEERPLRPPGAARREAGEARMEAPFGEARAQPPRPAPARAPAVPQRAGPRPQPGAPGRAPREQAARRPGAPPRPPAQTPPPAPAAGAAPEDRLRLERDGETRAAESQVAGRFASESQPGEEARTRAEAVARIPRFGLSLRDAVVAQTILGPPVSRARRPRVGRRTSIGRPREDARREPRSSAERP